MLLRRVDDLGTHARNMATIIKIRARIMTSLRCRPMISLGMSDHERAHVSQSGLTGSLIVSPGFFSILPLLSPRCRTSGLSWGNNEHICHDIGDVYLKQQNRRQHGFWHRFLIYKVSPVTAADFSVLIITLLYSKKNSRFP